MCLEVLARRGGLRIHEAIDKLQRFDSTPRELMQVSDVAVPKVFRDVTAGPSDTWILETTYTLELQFKWCFPHRIYIWIRKITESRDELMRAASPDHLRRERKRGSASL